MRQNVWVGAGVVLTVAAFCLPQDLGAAPVGDLYYMYFKQLVPLRLDSGHLALRSLDAQQRPAASTLLAHGLDPARLQELGLPGWAVAATPVPLESEAQAQLLVAQLAGSGDFAFVSPVFIDPRGLPLVITQDLLIGFNPEISAAQAEEILEQAGAGQIVERDFAGLAGVYRVRACSQDGFAVLELANALAEYPQVRFAEPDKLFWGELFLIPNDPFFPQQWGLHQANDQDMDCPEAWDITTGDPSIVVLVMDVGIQQDHPDLNQVPGQDFTGNNTPGGGPYNNCDNHGTCVAGCVSARINNSLGVVGPCPDCRSRSAKIGTTIQIFGFCTPFLNSTDSMVANAINYAVTSGARITNASFGMSASSVVTTAYANARAAGVVHFAAAGNDGSGSLAYPASLETVNAVAALSSNGSRASFSNYGPGLDFSAPGAGIWTTDRTGSLGYASGDYAQLDGTSFASPNAAGVAALVLSAAPWLTADQLEQVLRQTAVDLGPAGYDTGYGWGFINAYDAVRAVVPAYQPGDLNCDGAINAFDIDPFVLVLTDPNAYAGAYPNCNASLADINGDGQVNSFDIDPFVDLLTGR